MLGRRALAAACALLLPAAVSASFAPTCDPAGVHLSLPGVRFERCALLRGASSDAPALRMLWRVHDGNVTIGVHIDRALDALGYVGVGAGWNGASLPRLRRSILPPRRMPALSSLEVMRPRRRDEGS
jgi:hypothetical protein